MRVLALLLCLYLPMGLRGAPRACAGSQPVGTFRLVVRPPGGGPPLPVRLVNRLAAGSVLRCEPVKLPAPADEDARVVVVLGGPAELTVLDPRPAAAAAEWPVPHEVAVVSLIFGPQGLSVKKLKALIEQNQQLLTELADYAAQTSQVEGLVEALAASERSGGSLDAALTGFSSRYGVAMPKLDARAPTDQQAATLLRALLPSMTSYDPLRTNRATVMQQSAGLAASVAALFFGSPVGLAAGGASLFQNLRTLMFPGTEFRSAFAQLSADSLALCAKPQPARSRMRPAYLWAHRVPGMAKPQPALAGPLHLPIGSKSEVRLTGGKNLARARDWRLDPVAGGAPLPAAVDTAADDVLHIAVERSARPGEYRLRAAWDWEPLEIAGAVFLHPYGDLKAARIDPPSRDRLVEGSGAVRLRLSGADFQFVEKVAIEKSGAREQAPAELPFTLPKGKRMGTQEWLETEVDTAARGGYRLLLTQSDGLTFEVPLTILPPHPKLDGLPLRLNTGERGQSIALRGAGLERIEALESDAGDVALERGGMVVKLRPEVQPGSRFDLRMKVQGVQAAVSVPGALEVVGPRPRIAAARQSFAQGSAVALAPDELPAGAEVSIALKVENLAGIQGYPAVEVSCEGDAGLRRKILLTPGDREQGARLDLAGEGMLFLSLDPGAVGHPGCRLAATVAAVPTGRSDAHALGRVVRVPRIQRFVLTDEKIGDGVYAGILQGQDLDTIEKTGWDDTHALPVQSIPAPVSGEPLTQTLKVALPWPSPSPHAPVFVWLRGENRGRRTVVRY